MATTTASKLDTMSESIEDRPIPEGWHRSILDMSPEVYEFLEQLANRGRDDQDRCDSQSGTGLYHLALEARREGLTVGAVSDDQPLDTEFVGF